MNIRSNFMVLGMVAAILLSAFSVSAATWTTDRVSGSFFQSGLLNYGDGSRTLHARGISGTGTIMVKKVVPYAPDRVVASVRTKVGKNSEDVWFSESKTSNGTKQSYFYIWKGDTPSASANMRISD